MKKINLLLVLLTLTSCNLNSSKGYEFAHSALDSLLNEVSYDESIEVKNALYHEYDKDSNSIKVVKTKNIDDLESRFLGYLPFNVLSFLVKMSLQFVNSNC